MGAKGPKRTPPLTGAERLEKAKRHLLNVHLQSYHDRNNECANFDVKAEEIKANIDRLYKFLDAQIAKQNALLDEKYPPRDKTEKKEEKK